MISISALSPFAVIAMPGIPDRHGPELVIAFPGIRSYTHKGIFSPPIVKIIGIVFIPLVIVGAIAIAFAAFNTKEWWVLLMALGFFLVSNSNYGIYPSRMGSISSWTYMNSSKWHQLSNNR